MSRFASPPRRPLSPSSPTISYLAQADDLVTFSGLADEEARGLLHDTLHPPQNATEDAGAFDDASEPNPQDEDEDDEEYEREMTARGRSPWWKRPSPLWSVRLLS